MSRVLLLAVAHAWPTMLRSLYKARERGRAPFLVNQDDQGRPSRALWVDVPMLINEFETRHRSLPLALIECINRELKKQACVKGESCPS